MREISILMGIVLMNFNIGLVNKNGGCFLKTVKFQGKKFLICVMRAMQIFTFQDLVKIKCIKISEVLTCYTNMYRHMYFQTQT